jgi:hypothetical protein
MWEVPANAIEDAPSSEMFSDMQGDKICVLFEAITRIDDFLQQYADARGISDACGLANLVE